MLNPRPTPEIIEPLPQFSPEKSPPQEKRCPKWVTVRELPSGEFGGEFTLRCAGFLRTRGDAERIAADQIPARQDRMLRSLLSVIGESDAVEFRFTGGGGQQLEWEIRGNASRPSADEASESATNLLPSFIALAGSLGDYYRLQPVAARRREMDRLPAFRQQLRAEAIPVLVSPGRSLGFDTGADLRPDESRVTIPIFQPKKNFAFGSVAGLIAGAPHALCCAVRLRPVTLSKQQSRLVKEAAERIAEELASERRLTASGAPAEESLAGCKEALALWLTSGAGYRMEAEVSSSKPLSRALCNLITNELFPNNSAARDAALARPAVIPQNSLDLSNTIATRGTLPILFPDLQTLQREDVPQIYNRRKPRLPKTGPRLGHIDEPGLKVDVHADRAYRDRHAYIIGATGTGKSTMLFNSMVQDIYDGHGMCLIDPHGDLYEQLLCAIPASRQDDVILFNPCETDAVPGLNFLEFTSPETRAFEVNYAINEFVKMLDRLYDLRQTGGPIFEMYFRNALLLLADNRTPGYTLAELPAIFENPKFRNKLKETCDNRYAVNFWTQQAEKAGGEASLSNIAPYVTSKLNLLVQSALLRPIIGQSRSTIDFRAIMDNRQILLVNLSKGQLGEIDMQLLGMIIIGKIFSSAMSRCMLHPSKRVPFHLYVDEFQNFTTDTAAALLSEARKFQLILTLANQNLAQLKANQGKQDLLDAILGNVGNFVLFRLGAPDAEKMQVYTRPHFNQEDLQDLPNHHALARLQTSKGPTIPFVFKTEPPAKLPPNGRVRQAIRKRQRLYRTPREHVEKMIIARQNTDPELPLDKLIKLQQQPAAAGKNGRN